MNNRPPWVQEVINSQKKESNKKFSRWIQFATIGLDNSPRVRTVVFRGWNKEYEIEILTDNRSKKFKEIEMNNNVEICWLFPNSKCQFRFRGISKIDKDNEALTHWENLSPNTKSLWAWPRPGDPYEKDSFFPSEITEGTAILNNFILIEIVVNQVEQLVLQKPVHIRRRWLRNNDWIEERINP